MHALNSLDANVVLACRQRLEILSLSSPKGCGQLTDPGEPEWRGATAWWINRVEEKERTADLAIDVEHVHIVEGGIDLGTEAVRGRPQVGSVPPDLKSSSEAFDEQRLGRSQLRG